MITFGGRPLNTYKGGEMDWRRGIGDDQNPFADQSQSKSTTKSVSPSSTSKAIKSKTATDVVAPISKTTTEAIKTQTTMEPELVTIGPGNKTDVVIVDRKLVKISPGNKTDVVNVDPKLVKIEGPGLFDRSKTNDTNDANEDQSINGGGPQELLKLQRAIKKAEFNNRLVVKLFGKEIVLTVEFLYFLYGIIWKLITYAIICAICYYLYEITQGVLDAYHTVVDGITKLMEQINNVAIKFEVPGINKKIGPFNLSMPPLLKVDFKLFGGMFDGPLRDMYRAGEFTRSATELIIQILIQMVKGIAESLPDILDGVANAASKIGDSI